MRSFDYSQLSERLWDSDILSYVAKIHEHKGRQEQFIRQKSAGLDRLVEIAKIQSTEASNKIEGIVTTSTRMRQLMEEKTSPRNRDEKEILGYRDVLNTIHESHDYVPIKPAVILQLHRDLMAKADVSYGGKFKNVQNYIAQTMQDGSQAVRFTPMAPYETPDAIEAICDSYEKAISLEQIDPLVLIPVFICDFLCIHPFNDGNGRMSRLLTLLLLYKCGYEVGKYISLEKQIEKSKDAYYEALGQSDFQWQDGKNDPTPFVKYMLQMVLGCYVEFEQRVQLTDVKSSAYDVVLTYAKSIVGKFTSSDAIVACPSFGRSSVLSSLKALCDEGRIIRMGSGRNTYYVNASAIDSR
ncbi:MAG: Fic family protein [Sphaerochaetaceae bacterium]